MSDDSMAAEDEDNISTPLSELRRARTERRLLLWGEREVLGEVPAAPNSHHVSFSQLFRCLVNSP
jgi:hypothetical protein